MINPQAGTFTKSAMTRANNSKINAARATMVGNPAAQASLINQRSGGTPGGPPVGSSNPAPPAPPTAPAMPSVPPVGTVPGSTVDAAPTPTFDPEAFKRDTLSRLLGEIRTEHFLKSAPVKDAMETIRLKNAFNHANPNRVQDSRTLLEQVVTRAKLDRTGNGNS